MKLLVKIFTVVAILVASPALAQWVEQGDAGQLVGTSQSPTCTGPLATITGNLSSGTDVDMYCIQITGQYSAASCTVAYDTQLWLFRANSAGVSHNDDFCVLQSTLGLIQPGPGSYYLAISRYDTDALNGGGAEIWADIPFGDETPPDGAGGSLASWDVTNTSPAGTYTLNLTGVACCQGSTPVAPTTWGNIKSIYR